MHTESNCTIKGEDLSYENWIRSLEKPAVKFRIFTIELQLHD